MSTGVSQARLPSLDGIRGLAFLLVFADHAAWPAADGALGVTVFFFLSGYLITTLLLREEAATGRLDLRAFWIRRAFRILPLFYLVLAGTTLLTLIGARTAELDARALLAQALHASNYLFVYAGESGTPIGTDTYWSLAVEEHYYVVFPLLALLAVRRRLTRRTRAAVLLLLCAAVLAWRWVYVVLLETDYPHVYLRTYLATDMRVDGILWGALLAVVLDTGELRRRTPSAVQLMLAPVGLGALLLATTPDDLQYQLVWQTTAQALALALLFTGLLVRPPQLLQRRPLVWLGAVSYAAYLTHRAVLEALERLLSPGSLAVGLLGLALTLTIAEGCRRWVELPVARLRASLHPVAVGASPQAAAGAAHR